MVRLPRYPEAVPRLNQDGIAHEVDAYSTRTGAFVKVCRDRFRDLLLQIPQIVPLRRYAFPRQEGRIAGVSRQVAVRGCRRSRTRGAVRASSRAVYAKEGFKSR